ncbi:arsenical pump-driving ATPase [Azohydromonas caseinilytica]|uniref:Arsenical pump-driving ATPase n=1 Tax=Azohydromonas caseinilytica TaxID=2728836 RepID=A0A848FG81_9BURK|nr:arsenical pump-driving ATPase [Azohydromonas caseinilytica]NML17319.1 arsenical pump-driving ATPase [Azohydromonas caseinilytica]
MTASATNLLALLDGAPPFLFFTGKGGVGKTSLSCACALSLTDAGRRVLLVSTDPASNLDEMLATPLDNHPRPVPGAADLQAMNIDPEAAAEAYRLRVIGQMAPGSTEAERATVREQLSGACTTEIAAFDEFVALLADGAQGFDHVIFDTAPTGHTLRLLSLPKAWSGFLEGNDRGASCLGPHSGLKMQEARFRQALQALADAQRTRVVLVTRPDAPALKEAARTRAELVALGLANQWLAINGALMEDAGHDAVAAALQAQQRAALDAMPENLRTLPRSLVPLRGFDMVGLPALRALLDDAAAPPPQAAAPAAMAGVQPLGALVDELARAPHALIMVMGKGGVGKTTIAAALAVALAERGKSVHLSTTDPAAHLAATLEDGSVPGLQVDRIDPHAETQRYIDKIMASKGRGLDEAARALMLEDLRSPCTEEVAVFHAFSRIVSEARSAFVILDTAPTGHTLLLMDATGAYHRQMVRDFEGAASTRVVTPLMRLQDPSYTRIVLVTLPETTPVSEAAALQEDLRRARIEPFAWVVNRSLAASGTASPVLRSRIAGEHAQMQRVAGSLAQRAFVVPWCPEPPIGIDALEQLASEQS